MKDREPNHRRPPHRRDEERQHTRIEGAALPDLTAFIRRGKSVRIIDVSKRGALIECDERLCPGRNVSLRFVTPGEEVALTGFVVRSWVSNLSKSQLVYRTALNFTQDTPVLQNVKAQPTSAADELNSDAEPLDLVAAVRQTAKELTAMFTADR